MLVRFRQKRKKKKIELGIDSTISSWTLIPEGGGREGGFLSALHRKGFGTGFRHQSLPSGRKDVMYVFRDLRSGDLFLF